MPRPSSARLALVVSGTLLVLLGVPFWMHHASVDSASSVVLPDVRERVLKEGRVRVIAEMRLPGPHVPEGRLPSAAVTVQRNDIANVRGQILARLAGRTHRLLRQYTSVPLVALEVGPDALTELEASSTWVKQVVVDTINAPTLPDSVPLIGANQAWSRGYDGTGLVVAIVDTGVEASHPFLAGKVVEEACYSSNVTGQSVTVCPNGQTQQTGPGAGASCPLSNSCWHGTHVAGIAAGNGGGAGVAFSGVAKGAQVMAVQVFSKFTRATDCGGSAPCVLAWTSDIIAGLERVYAVRGTRNLASANLSLGGGQFTSPCDTDPTKSIIDNLRAAGIATAIAAGNNGWTNAVSAPGCISSAISVGATTKGDVVASYSNVASFVSLFAPGSSITSSVTGGGFGGASGTSMATPHVTGAWAVLKQAAPGASVSEILASLQNTGQPIADTRSGGTVTKPRIRVDLALASFVPTVSSVVPNQGSAGSAVQVTINGAGFSAGSVVSLSGTGVSVSNVMLVSATQLSATLTIAAGAAAGARNLTVTNSNGASGTLTDSFSVMAGAAGVTVSSVTPSQGMQGVAVPVTITGAGFTAGAGVTLSGTGVTVSNVSVGSGSQVTATLTVAAGTPLGARDITITNPGGGSGTLTGGFVVTAPVAVGSIAPSQGAPGATVSVTVGGSGFAAGATLGLGAGITVSNLSVASPSQITATLTLAAGAALGTRDVTVTNPGGATATLAGGFTVASASPASLSLAYNGLLRDRVGQGNTALAPDGALDGTFTVTLTASGGKTITRLRLDSSAPGTWDTDSTTVHWALAVAPSLDGTLLNAAGSMAVNFPVANGGSFVLFASDSLGIEFQAGRTLTLTATFSDGSTAQASTIVATAVTVAAVSPNQGAPGVAVPVTITGSGFATGATLSLSGTGITVSNVSIAGPTQLTATLTVASGAAPGARDVTVANPGGATATLAGGFTVASASPASLSFAYNGLLRDRVGQGNTVLAPDGALDGTFTVTLTASGGKTITRLRLDSSAPGTWDTDSSTVHWALAVASSLDGTLLNAAGSMAVNFPVANGGSFVLFASDSLGLEFQPGRTLTLTATFSDGSSAQTSTVVATGVAVSAVSPDQGAPGAAVPVTIAGSGFAAGATLGLGAGITVSNLSVASPSQITATLTLAAGVAPGARDVTVTNPGGATATLAGGFTVASASPASLSLAYNGLLRDRVGQGNTVLAPDGALDGTFTVTLTASGGKTITRLRLDSSAPGTWDTDSSTVHWVLAVAPSLDGALHNAAGSMAVNFPVANGGSFVLFASDSLGLEFQAGRTLTLTATFSDGSAAQVAITMP